MSNPSVFSTINEHDKKIFLSDAHSNIINLFLDKKSLFQEFEFLLADIEDYIHKFIDKFYEKNFNFYIYAYPYVNEPFGVVFETSFLASSSNNNNHYIDIHFYNNKIISLNFLIPIKSSLDKNYARTFNMVLDSDIDLCITEIARNLALIKNINDIPNLNNDNQFINSFLKKESIINQKLSQFYE